MLKEGTKAPDFTLPDQNGKFHSLSEYRGKRVILYFFRRTIPPDVRNRLADSQKDIRSFVKKVL